MTPRLPASPRIVTLLLLVASAAATFAEALSGTKALFERDIIGFWYPQRTALRAALAHGEFPLWNPWFGFGTPFLADASAQLAYPLTWLTLPLPLHLQFGLLALLHCMLAGAGAAALAQRRGGGLVSSTVAAVSYALAGPLLSALGLYHHFAGAAWMPWVMWALDRLIARPNPRGALLLAGFAALQVLAGSGDLVLMTALLGMARLAHAAWVAGRRGAASLALPLTLAGSLAAGLSAVQWLPTLERALAGPRAVLHVRTNTYWSLHPGALVDFTVPRLVSESSLSPDQRERLFEGREPLLSCLYLGVMTLALAAAGLTLRPSRELPLAAGMLALLLLALGRHGPLYAALLHVPGFAMLRYPQKFLLPFCLCLALLAAAGAEGLAAALSAAERRRVRALALALLGLAAVLVASAVLQGNGGSHDSALKLGRSAVLAGIAAWLVERRAAQAETSPALIAAFVVVATADLILVGRATNPVAPVSLLDQRPRALEWLTHAPGRLHASAESAACLNAGSGPEGWPPTWLAALGGQQALRPPAAARFFVFGSYDGEFTGLGPRFTAPFKEVLSSGLATPAAQRLLRLGGVEYVAFLGHEAPPGFERVATLPTTLSCPLQLLRVSRPLPRVYAVGAEHDEGGDARAAVLAAGFDAESEVVLAGARPGASVAVRADARVAARTANTLTVQADFAGPGVLVASEAYDEGWGVEVDGAPGELLRANGMFRAVRLAAGRHEVVFRYRPWTFRVGAVATALSLVALLWLARREPRRFERAPAGR